MWLQSVSRARLYGPTTMAGGTTTSGWRADRRSCTICCRTRPGRVGRLDTHAAERIGDVRALQRLHRAPAPLAAAGATVTVHRSAAGGAGAPVPTSAEARLVGAADAADRDPLRRRLRDRRLRRPSRRLARRARAAEVRRRADRRSGAGAGCPGFRWPSPADGVFCREQPPQVRVHRSRGRRRGRPTRRGPRARRGLAATGSAAATSSPRGRSPRWRWWPNTPRRCCATAASCRLARTARPAEEASGAPRPRRARARATSLRSRCTPYPAAAPPSPALVKVATDARAVPRRRRAGSARCKRPLGSDRSSPRGPSDRCGASFSSHGHRVRDRQSEGRRRQDDDRGQPRRLRRRGRLRVAADRHRSAVQRHARARDRQAHPARPSTTR